jgi:hypothetical protein
VRPGVRDGADYAFVRVYRAMRARAGASPAFDHRMERSSIVQMRVPSVRGLKVVAGEAVPAAPRAALVAALASLVLSAGAPAFAQDLPAVSIGGGLRTSFVHTEFDDEDVSEDADTNTDRFFVDNARLYVNGSVTRNIKFTLNTDYSSSDNTLQLLDAVGQISFSPAANIWMGRFLPPSDRANLYGPFYAHHWGVFTDGLQDSYPMVYQGRANGVMYWGQFDKLKVSAGMFDGPSLDLGGAGNFGGDDGDLMFAARLHYDFWDAEDGYYLNSTYYGDKNILAFGVAGQIQGEDHTAWSADFLLERKVGMGGAYTVEAEWTRYSQLGLTFFPADTTDGGYVLGSYLFPGSGTGRWEILGKYASANLKGFGPKETLQTSEINLNYIIKQFNARVMFFYIDQRWDLNPSLDTWRAGAGLQLQM